MSQPTGITTTDTIGRLIHSIRGHRVILDGDLAAIYGVQTFRFNEAVKRNRARFPNDFMFRLSQEEWEVLLRSQNAILKTGRGRHRKYAPYAFTEHGAVMAANVLNSGRAVAMSIYVICAFITLREELAANTVIPMRWPKLTKLSFSTTALAGCASNRFSGLSASPMLLLR